MTLQQLQQLLIAIPPLLMAIVLHEFMHGYTAYRLGDPTARQMGRLTLNPIAHIDPFGSILLPLMLFVFKVPVLFAYAKPVPVNFFRLRNPKKDMVWVAAAGPLANLTLAAISGLFFRILISLAPAGAHSQGVILPFFLEMAVFSVRVNVLLALFNLIPIPPLDGGRIVVGLLPAEQAAQFSRVERYGMYILMGILVLQPFDVLEPLWHFVYFLSKAFLGI